MTPLATIKTRTKVIIGYGEGRGETAWIRNEDAEALIAGFRRKKTATPRALYLIRCKPRTRR